MELKANEYRVACRGCHGGCVHIATVEDGRLVKLRPDPDAPLNRGHMCEKGATILEQMYHPDRLTHPLRRTGPRGSGQFERIGWDEALDEIAQKLSALKEAYGARCISAITGTGRHLVPYLWRFTRAIGTPNIASAGALICLGPRKNAGFSTSGTYGCVDYYGEVQPKLLLVWGSNPTVSGADGELQWHPARCVKDGARLIVVDPQRTELAARAELWLRIRPGTDGALALGLIHVLIREELYDRAFVETWGFGFDELRERCAAYDPATVSRITRIPEEQILRAARLMASVKPMGLEWGCAFEQSYNATQTCRAIYMLPALTGNYDVPGGFVESKHIAPTKREPMQPSPDLLNRYPYRMLKPYAHPHQVLDAIRTGDPYKIRAMLSFANNTVVSLPDSRRVRDCLKELEFFVCMDVFMTPTAALADIVLPAALWPELDCVFCMPEFAEHTVLCQQKLVQVGECRADEEVFLALCRRMGVDYGADSQRELLDGELRDMSRRFPEMEGLDFAALSRLGYYTPRRRYRNYESRGGFPTPSGKYEFWSREMESLGADPLPFWTEPPASPVRRTDLKEEFPYILTTGGRRMQYFITNNRQIRSLRRQYPFPLVRMHPDTAAAHGVADGDWVYIRTFRGRITQKAKLEPDMDPQVVNVDFGWWYPEAGAPGFGWDESNANVLTSTDDGCDSYMGSYCLRGLLCNIYKNEDRSIEERYYRSSYYAELPRDESSASIVIDPEACILCGDCVQVCRTVQGVGALEINLQNGLTAVRAGGGGALAATDCVGCGQCRAACARGAIRIRSDLDAVRRALADERCFTAVQVAPSARVGVGGHLGFARGKNCMPQVVGALRKLGFDAVYDTVFAADMTVVAEAEEFLRRVGGGGPLPLFTSCCPAWVKFCETRWPAFAPQLSTCRSPQQMLGSVLRDRYRETDGRRLVSVSVMPCTAKKAELLRPESRTGGVRDVDVSLTTTELLELLEQAGVTAADCEPGEADAPFAGGSGGGSLFGVSGGVTEAVLRYLAAKPGGDGYEWLPPAEEDPSGLRRFRARFGGQTLEGAVVSGLATADWLMARVRDGLERPVLVEVMACPGGCIMGGGQPADVYETARDQRCRADALRRTDEESAVRASQDNAALRELWQRGVAADERRLLHRAGHGD